MSSKNLARHTENHVTLTLAEIFRNDQFGEWSFKEIGFRLAETHPNYNPQRDFHLIDIPRSTHSQNSWDVAVKMLAKNKTASQIQSVLNFMSEKNLFPKPPQAKLG